MKECRGLLFLIDRIFLNLRFLLKIIRWHFDNYRELAVLLYRSKKQKLYSFMSSKDKNKDVVVDEEVQLEDQNKSENTPTEEPEI